MRFTKTLKLLLASLLLSSIGSVFAAEEEKFDVEATYQAKCFACHGTGAAHAPVVGDIIAWEIRMEKGMDTVVQNSIDGLNGIMPPRGLCVDCSDEQLEAIVHYMIENSQ